MQLKLRLNDLKKQCKYYSGKKKKHTLKVQIVADEKTLKILCISFSEGKKHDFKLFKDSELHFLNDILILADTGYLGITKIHANSQTPKKSSKKHPLTSDEKAYNFAISRRRIYIEHINRYIKRFKILSSRYGFVKKSV